MGTKIHKKRQNTGLLYEFLVRQISTALVDDDKKRQAAALRAIKRHFKVGSELQKELRLVRSLMVTTVSTPQIAAAIVNEARAAAQALDHEKLVTERRRLLTTIAREFDEDSFFTAQIDEYRSYATIQTLFNEWRRPSHGDVVTRPQYEGELTKLLITEKKASDTQLVNSETPTANRLLAHVMTKKLNEKYGQVLDRSQRDLIRCYATMASQADEDAIKRKLIEIRDTSISALPLGAVSDLARAKLVAETLEGPVTDDVIVRFMLYRKLQTELIDSAAGRVVSESVDRLDESAPRLLHGFQLLEYTKKTLSESRDRNGGHIVLAGILQKADTLNQNGRIYPQAILEREVRNYQKFINENRSTGELDHPDSSVISLKNVSHKIIEARMDGKDVWGRVMVLNTPSGKILQDLLEGEVKIGISSRGVGSTREQGDYVIVQDDFQLICWDAVSEPSTPGAFIIPEGKSCPAGLGLREGRALSHAERVERLLHEIADVRHYAPEC